MSPTVIPGNHRGVQAPLVSEVPISETGGPDQVVGPETTVTREAQWAIVEGGPAGGAILPIPHGPMTVGIEGGYIHNWEEKQQHFEVTVTKSILAFRRYDEVDIASSKCFGVVQILDEKPKRRLFEALKSQGHQLNQQITVLSEPGERSPARPGRHKA